MKLLRSAKACCNALIQLIILLAESVSQAPRKYNPILQKYIPAVCLTAIEQYVNFVTAVYPLPFVQSCTNTEERPKSGVPFLCAAQGPRKYAVIFVHFLILFRLCCFLAFICQSDLQIRHNGMFTSDLWFTATLLLTALAMLCVWIKTWRWTSLFCWIHNEYCKLNRNFSGRNGGGWDRYYCQLKLSYAIWCSLPFQNVSMTLTIFYWSMCMTGTWWPDWLHSLSIWLSYLWLTFRSWSCITILPLCFVITWMSETTLDYGIIEFPSGSSLDLIAYAYLQYSHSSPVWFYFWQISAVDFSLCWKH